MSRNSRRFGALLLSLSMLATCFLGFGNVVTAVDATQPAVKTGYGVIENFSEPLTLTNGMKFGKDEALTMITAGIPTFDNSSLNYLQVTEPKNTEAYIITTTNALPATYKISVDVGTIDYPLSKKPSDEENGMEFLTITNAVPKIALAGKEVDFNVTRKVMLNTDDNGYNYPGNLPLPIFAGYNIPPDGKSSIFYTTKWSLAGEWPALMSYDPTKWYTFQIEKTSTDYIYTISNALTGTLIKTCTIAISKVAWATKPDYLVIGDPYANYYLGSVKLANICIVDTSLFGSTATPIAVNTNTPTPTSDSVTTSVFDNISIADEQDLFSFVANTSGSYTIKSVATLDTYGYLYDSSMALITSDDDSAGNGQFLVTSTLTAGQSYYVKVKAYSESDTGAYELQVIGPAPAVIINKIAVSPTPTQGGDFTYTISNSTAMITKYSGVGGDINIPSTLGGYPVTSINSSAFQWCKGLTSVNIPSSVTSIGYQAFFVCTGLTQIDVDNNNGQYSSQDGILFNKTKTSLIQYPAGKTGSCIIPNSVTGIGAWAFYNCKGLTSVNIPNSVTIIGDSAFYCCSGLNSVNIPTSVTSIGNSAFGGCTGLTEIIVYDNNLTYASQEGVLFNKAKTSLIQYPSGKKGSYIIPNGVDSIGYYAFGGCTGLTSVTIPNSVTSIGAEAFESCGGLTSVNIPDSVTSIGDYAFVYSYQLTEIVVNVYNASYSSQEGVLFNKTKTKLIQYPDSKTGSYVIPNDVTIIVDYAFFGCTGLTSVTIPTSVTSIGDSTFSSCTGLTAAYFLGNAPTMGSNIFYLCESTFKVYYISGNTGFTNPWYGYATETFSSLTTPTPTATNTPTLTATNTPVATVYTYTISNSAATITGYTGPGGDVTIPSILDGYPVVCIDGAFSRFTGMFNLTIPNSVTRIGYMAFRGCGGLTNVTIGDGVTSIGDWAFDNCTGLTNVNIGSNVTNIGVGAFEDCSSLTSVAIPNKVTYIDVLTFDGCTGLTSVTIGSGVTSIDRAAFSGCTGLTNVTIPNSVTSIGDTAFSRCTKLTSVTIGNSVTSIAKGAFAGCTGLTSVIIPNSVIYIEGGFGSGAFYGCTGLTSVTIGNRVEYIGEQTFFGCTGLTSVTIPDSVLSIGDWAFSNCTGLTSIIIGSGVTNMGGLLFSGCKVLSQIIVFSDNLYYSSLDGVLFNKTKTSIIEYPEGYWTLGSGSLHCYPLLHKVYLQNHLQI